MLCDILYTHPNEVLWALFWFVKNYTKHSFELGLAWDFPNYFVCFISYTPHFMCEMLVRCVVHLEMHFLLVRAPPLYLSFNTHPARCGSYFDLSEIIPNRAWLTISGIFSINM